METVFLDMFKSIFFEEAGMFEKTFMKVESDFGQLWIDEFNEHLGKLFGKDELAYKNAALGYSKFAIDSIRLQRIFNKKRKYEDVTYEEACEKVYMNENYMMELYLPGIFISSFLWRHHYKQLLFYKNKFLPLLDKMEDKRFYDVGTGTGFYSVQIFRHDKNFKGNGIDISPHSRQFTKKHVTAWGFDSNFTSMNLNIIGADIEPAPCIQAIEVLEHLSDPQLFLNNLRKLLKPNGYGFITAALTAPNADHIYLYWDSDDVIKQLVSAGFKIEDYIEEIGYEPRKPGELVPKLAAFIVS
jgi:2-polyprenyl-3-methyl-5-hydroxy-6-metoxy-1,4-benzoquinol methylase